MHRVRRYALTAVLVALPFAAGACKISLGNGCNLLVGEPGAQVGVACNF